VTVSKQFFTNFYLIYKWYIVQSYIINVVNVIRDFANIKWEANKWVRAIYYSGFQYYWLNADNFLEIRSRGIAKWGCETWIRDCCLKTRAKKSWPYRLAAVSAILCTPLSLTIAFRIAAAFFCHNETRHLGSSHPILHGFPCERHLSP